MCTGTAPHVLPLTWLSRSHSYFLFSGNAISIHSEAGAHGASVSKCDGAVRLRRFHDKKTRMNT